MTRRIEFTVPDEVGELYDRARGHEPMASWIKRALESALSDTASGDGPSSGHRGSEIPSRSASSRAPDTDLRALVRGDGDATYPPPVSAPKTRAELALERQAKLNKAKS